MIIRLFQEKDLDQVLNLFYDTVHQVNVQDYTTEQLDVWAPRFPNQEKWLNKLLESYCLVVEKDNKIIGFSNIYPHGQLDCLYVHYQYIHQGIGKLLLQSLEAYAISQNEEKIFVDVSLTALEMFKHFSYQIIEKQNVERKGIILVNYKMVKVLKTVNFEDN